MPFEPPLPAPLGDLPAATRDALIGAGAEQRFADGEALMQAGEPGDSLHLVLAGAVRVVDPSGAERATLGAGAVVGEIAVLTGEGRSADAIAAGAVRTWRLEREAALGLLPQHPELADLLTRLLAERLGRDGTIQRVGKYEIERRLGAGATATVYAAQHPTLGRRVAIKMLHHSLSFDPAFSSRFLDEARVVAGLAHPNIVQVYDAEHSYGTLFLVMEFVRGGDVEELLERTGPLPVEQVLSIVRQVAAALRFAHEQGVVHRDVKPANCLHGADGRVRLMDFGMAAWLRTGRDRSMVVDGTPKYLSPEVAMGHPATGKSDLYSLGITAFELLTGAVPFASDSLRALLQMHARMPVPDLAAARPDVPPGLRAFVEGALRKDPADRPDWDEVERLLAAEQKRELWSVGFPAGAEATVEAAVDQLVAAGASVVRAPVNG